MDLVQHNNIHNHILWLPDKLSAQSPDPIDQRDSRLGFGNRPSIQAPDMGWRAVLGIWHYRLSRTDRISESGRCPGGTMRIPDTWLPAKK
jgi:hypothetical protein